MKSRLKYLAILIPGVLLALGVTTVFRACAVKDDGTWMHCHDTQNWLLVFGFIICVLGLRALLTDKRAAHMILSAASLILGLAAAVLPGTLLSLCGADTMRCRMLMTPFARLMGILIAVLSLCLFLSARKEKA